MSKEVPTLGERLHWAYANLAMADKALRDGDPGYGRVHYMIRAKLFKGLNDGTMALASILPDERIKIEAGACCSYCGATAALAVDHILPRAQGGRGQR